MGTRPSYEELEARLRTMEAEVRGNPAPDGSGPEEADIRLAQIIQGTSIPTFVIGADHRVTHWNRACENLTGLTEAEMVGTRDQWRAFYDHRRPVMADLLVDEADPGTIAVHYKDKYRQSRVIDGAFEAEDFFPALGSKGKWLFFTAAPIRDSAGRITGAIETLQDISERKWAEAILRDSVRRYKRFIDFVPYPVVVFTLDGYVSYVNPMFTQTFHWTLEELKGGRIPYIPPGLEEETRQKIEDLVENEILLRYETRRLTREGRILDMVLRAAVFPESENEPAGILLIHRDITQEKRIARNNAAMLRISTAMPEYTGLKELLDYISNEIKRLLNAEGSAVILLDEENEELYIPGAAYDDSTTEKRVKGLRFSLDQIMAGKVIRTGEPLITQDGNTIPREYPERDGILGYHTHSLVEVPLRSGDRPIGVLAALNKKEGPFDDLDVELLNMIAGTVALSVENARFSDDLKEAYQELRQLNQAKDRMINHLSHELKTPISVLAGSLNILEKRLSDLPEASWRSTTKRARRNLQRLSDIQEEVEDILQARGDRSPGFLTRIYDQCVDELEVLLAEELGEGDLIRKLRRRLIRLFAPDKESPARIDLSDFVSRRLRVLARDFEHREVEIVEHLSACPPILIPEDPLAKVVDGLVRNAVENTPDEGRIEVSVDCDPNEVRLSVHDYGVGITAESRKRIFHGFHVTRDTLSYSTKRPFDFYAGGKGADLLRMKIFSERYGFRIEMESERCGYIPDESDLCPGRIADCPFCRGPEDCRRSGRSRFSVIFPAGPGAEIPVDG